MNVRLMALCDYASQTREGKLNMMGIFDALFAASFPVRHPSMFLVLRLEVAPSEIGHDQTMIVKIADEDGRKLLELQGKLTTNRPDGRTLTYRPFHLDNLLHLQQIEFPHAGEYRVDVLVNSQAVAALPLHLVQREGPGV